MLVVLRSLEELSNLGGEQIVFPLLVVQKVTEPALGKSKPLPWSHVEIPHAHSPRSFEGRLSVLIGMFVEFIAEGHAAKSEAKLRFVNLMRSIGHCGVPRRSGPD
jgi:hypothetical protein